MTENPNIHDAVSQMLNQQELQTASDEEELKVIRLLNPFHKKINQAIYELTELNILFSHSTNNIETILEKLKIEFSKELVRASKPFTDGQIKTRGDLRSAIDKIYDGNIFKRWKEELNHIAKGF
jgi:aminoglycoside phosphotransferase family enzyme